MYNQQDHDILKSLSQAYKDMQDQKEKEDTEEIEENAVPSTNKFPGRSVGAGGRTNVPTPQTPATNVSTPQTPSRNKFPGRRVGGGTR